MARASFKGRVCICFRNQREICGANFSISSTKFQRNLPRIDEDLRQQKSVLCEERWVTNIISQLIFSPKRFLNVLFLSVLLTISFRPLLNNVEMACNVVHVVLKKVAVVVRQTSKGEGNDWKKKMIKVLWKRTSVEVEVKIYELLTRREVEMAGYWLSYFLALSWTETKSRYIKTGKKKEALMQPSWPNKLE